MNLLTNLVHISENVNLYTIFVLKWRYTRTLL
jgi:hypothetical protein